MRSFKPVISLVCLMMFVGFALAQPNAQPLAHDALVGKWKATVTDDNGKDSTDNLTFKGGQFTSENEKTDGFDATTYQDDPGPQGIGAKFEVTLTNKAGDTAKWSGLSTGAEMEGTLVITEKDGTTKTYSFKAEKK